MNNNKTMIKYVNSSHTKNIINDLQDYMFTFKNIDKFTKNIINFNDINFNPKSIPKPKPIDISKHINKDITQINLKDKNVIHECEKIKKETKKDNDIMYKPKQKDSLFWCFYILKNGFSKYEIEANNQYFVIEKKEKFKYIELLRQKKELLKIHKIKPLSHLEDELANGITISVKTFFSLCILENINVLLVDKHKVYELLMNDTNKLNIVHRNENENFIELEPTEEIVKKYREKYYKINSFETKLKSMSSYKLGELKELCNKLNINIEEHKNKQKNNKITKKDIYDLLVLNY